MGYKLVWRRGTSSPDEPNLAGRTLFLFYLLSNQAIEEGSWLWSNSTLYPRDTVKTSRLEFAFNSVHWIVRNYRPVFITWGFFNNDLDAPSEKSRGTPMKAKGNVKQWPLTELLLDDCAVVVESRFRRFRCVAHVLNHPVAQWIVEKKERKKNHQTISFRFLSASHTLHHVSNCP